MIPLLSRPGALALKNRITHAPNPLREGMRHLFIIGLGFLIGFASFSGTTSTLASLAEYDHLYFISPTRLLELLFFFLFTILALTSSISFLSVFLLSHDLELLRASPLQPFEFITGKFTELMGLSGWILLFFGLPVFLAYGVYFDHPILFYTSIFFLFPTFLLLATGVGALVVLVISFLIPAYRVRECALLLSLLAISGSYIWFRSEDIQIGEAQALADLVRLALISSNTPMAWFPSTWFAAVSASLLHGPPVQFGPYLPLILGATGLTLSLLYVGLRYGYEYLYSRSVNKRYSKVGQEPIFVPIHRLISACLPSITRAFFFKELRVFLRDVTQSVQLILLLTLCLVYLYNFQSFEHVLFLPDNAQYAWNGLLSLINVFMGSFVLIALAARFAFPSVSLEGKSWWILQSSPLSVRDILQEKLEFWSLLFMGPITIIFVSGALALQLPLSLVVLHALLGASLCHLYLGLGVSFGARYRNFHWDHPAQLTSSFGNFYFMVFAMGLMFLLLIPIAIITGLHTLFSAHLEEYSALYEVAAIGCAILFVRANIRYVNRRLDEEAKAIETSIER